MSKTDVHGQRHRLCAVDEINEGGAKGFEVNGVDLFAVKKRGRVYLYRNTCPHAGLPLNWLPDRFLDREGELILCTSHGALFRIDTGQCVAGPCPGQYLQPLQYHIDNDVIWLDTIPSERRD